MVDPPEAKCPPHVAANLAAMVLTPEEREFLALQVYRKQAVDGHRRSCPTDWYRPHCDGQRQFHESRGIVRALFPGNGFGKTTAAGAEAHWWATGTHPFQPTPKRAVILIWCCETFKQFKILRSQLEAECFGNIPRYNKVDNVYTWPNGSQLFLVSGDSSWTHVQGINPDAVFFDEEPPEALWNEMKMRRRGVRKTRFVFSATATQGMTWMYRDLYLPWLNHHKEQGLDEQGAYKTQNHPRLWVWAKGGITSNPGADAGDRDWYASQTFNSEAERSVRMSGGFADFSGTPVFDLQALELQRPNLKDGEDGRFARVPATNPDDPRCITVTDRATGATSRARLAWVADGEQERGRITVYRQPVPGAKYVIGHDSAYGLTKGDFDAAVVLERNTGEVVAVAVGHWGDAMWAEILFGLGWHFNQAFICGERQVGLMVMRRLYDELGYSYQYFRRDESKRDRRQSDDLGHHRAPGDLTIGRLRIAIGRRKHGGQLDTPDVVIRDRELYRQCNKFQFRPRRESLAIHECHDADLEVGAPKGDHDDLVLAFGYGVMALHEVGKSDAKELPYPDDSYGAAFNIRERFAAPSHRAADPFAREDV